MITMFAEAMVECSSKPNLAEALMTIAGIGGVCFFFYMILR